MSVSCVMRQTSSRADCFKEYIQSSHKQVNQVVYRRASVGKLMFFRHKVTSNEQDQGQLSQMNEGQFMLLLFPGTSAVMNKNCS